MQHHTPGERVGAAPTPPVNSFRGLFERVLPAIRVPTRASEAESIVRELFGLAGIEIGGTNPATSGP